MVGVFGKSTGAALCSACARRGTAVVRAIPRCDVKARAERDAMAVDYVLPRVRVAGFHGNDFSGLARRSDELASANIERGPRVAELLCGIASWLVEGRGVFRIGDGDFPRDLRGLYVVTSQAACLAAEACGIAGAAVGCDEAVTALYRRAGDDRAGESVILLAWLLSWALNCTGGARVLFRSSWQIGDATGCAPLWALGLLSTQGDQASTQIAADPLVSPTKRTSALFN